MFQSGIRTRYNIYNINNIIINNTYIHIYTRIRIIIYTHRSPGFKEKDLQKEELLKVQLLVVELYELFRKREIEKLSGELSQTY